MVVLLASSTGLAGGARGDFGAGEDPGVRPVRQVGAGGDGKKNDVEEVPEEEEAGPPGSRWAQKPWSVIGALALASHGRAPQGFAGVRIGVGLGAYFAIEVGASASSSPTFLGAWILRLPMTRGLAVHFAGAVARGRYVSDDPGADYPAHVYEQASWAMLELGIEHRSRGGWVVRGSLGLADLLDRTSFRCGSGPDDPMHRCAGSSDGRAPYDTSATVASFALGHAFLARGRLWRRRERV